MLESKYRTNPTDGVYLNPYHVTRVLRHAQFLYQKRFIDLDGYSQQALRELFAAWDMLIISADMADYKGPESSFTKESDISETLVWWVFAPIFGCDFGGHQELFWYHTKIISFVFDVYNWMDTERQVSNFKHTFVGTFYEAVL